MRTRGRPVLLDRALASVAAQTFTDYELVVVNDGGDRNTVEELVRRHVPDRGRASHHAEHVGLYSPPNAPIAETASTYVAIHDDDDSWDPAFLERTTKHLADSGSMGVVAAAAKVTERIEDDRIVTVETEPLFPGLHQLSLYELCFTNYATPIAFLYRREAYEAVGGYDESLETVADWDFALRFALRLEIDFLPSERPLAFYRHRPDAGPAELNVVYTDRHRDLEARLANRWLRADIEAGRAGLGFVINALRHDYDAGESMFVREKEASDDRVRYLAESIEKLDARITELQNAVTAEERLKGNLRLLRSLPRRLARRPKS